MMMFFALSAGGYLTAAVVLAWVTGPIPRQKR